MWDCMKIESDYRPKKALYTISKSVTSNCTVSVWKFSRVPKVTGREIWPTGGCCYPRDYAME
jgi:hypothetical protein